MSYLTWLHRLADFLWGTYPAPLPPLHIDRPTSTYRAPADHTPLPVEPPPPEPAHVHLTFGDPDPSPPPPQRQLE